MPLLDTIKMGQRAIEEDLYLTTTDDLLIPIRFGADVIESDGSTTPADQDWNGIRVRMHARSTVAAETTLFAPEVTPTTSTFQVDLPVTKAQVNAIPFPEGSDGSFYTQVAVYDVDATEDEGTGFSKTLIFGKVYLRKAITRP